ncbi:hypothetical protein H5410_013999 [Solanum commersonii]|uniref:Uncharacterized protein n=1 Tax=Solanum commersonii TaxID=4109 RepID=A0A9J5ZQ57_SOLCO|nr:hypothetical protein H5410_013999 [Solanum commersonii]
MNDYYKSRKYITTLHSTCAGHQEAFPLGSLSRRECKHSLESLTLGFVDNTIALTASATISRCESPRRYPTEDFCGCSYASRAAQSYDDIDKEKQTHTISYIIRNKRRKHDSFFPSQRRLGEGDPSSPFYFLTVMWNGRAQRDDKACQSMRMGVSRQHVKWRKNLSFSVNEVTGIQVLAGKPAAATLWVRIGVIQTISVIPQVGYGEGGVYAALPRPREGREVVSDR